MPEMMDAADRHNVIIPETNSPQFLIKTQREVLRWKDQATHKSISNHELHFPSGSLSLPLANQNPRNPGKFMLAIELILSSS
jgi:hypothetical protein